MTASRPLSLVTGASSGIGAAFARQLAALGHDLVLTARRADRLETLAAELREQHAAQAIVLPRDLADPATPRALCDELDRRSLQVDWLVNNAGYGVPGTFVANDWTTHADFLQVLLTAPTELAWRLLPGMRQRGHGRIINVASLAGHVPGPAGHTLYAASKAYLIKFSQSLALENRAAGVNVCALCPGFTWSEFHDITGTRDKMNRLPGFMWLSAEEVVRQGLAAVERGDAVYIPGRVNRTIKTLVHLLPDRLALWLSARESKRYRNT
ncbi:dehydrogenase [Rhodanobacter sp. FW510-R12]|uniref:SDR family NAD(P)-dependent oxidoreductase n=1 Tax=unclassified Rhodanobacter TaxID=2621553 RepID=UPI0007AA25E2|nr:MULTISPECIES: SDR family oxidoreductase [unclassified Rhodanobacter]KZC18378.1 dehydrogenase [Rhodanobacter sp. FW104-R8]KZC29043.1 dehydrogenase [Rhodanobacter sp. FW510-T8]KZC30420.1 dehydrogenase [Rhodanobacter sp. FW510-R10]